ncbi:MAG: AMP nucleosidase [Alphaproteobacteria bacterium]|nr:MAG: AMP nucleosidase [Alphaproteobacteria bacterium]
MYHPSTSYGSLEALPAVGLALCEDAATALERMVTIYEQGIAMIKEDFESFVAGQLRGRARRAVYPYLAAEVEAGPIERPISLAYGKVNAPGFYGTTVSEPRLFENYLIEQMNLLITNHKARFYVGRSQTPIPLTFALERAAASLSLEQRADLRQRFAMPDLVTTNDDIADGRHPVGPGEVSPLSLFPAERVDYSLHRLRHYTATSPEHFQQFVLFTNYQRYVDEFIEFGRKEVEAGSYDMLVEPGDRIHRKGRKPSRAPVAKPPQMPAYHLVREGRTGITLVNIGVGPSNAKTVTDHLAVLRSHVWLMVGHCGGLRGSQRLGDYVLAHAYLRDDHVLDQALPPAIPLPTIAEVQLALASAVSEVTGLQGKTLKDRLRTGTVVTTDDRNWELRIQELGVRFNQSRAIAIDMESATIAANAYRFRVPYGTLLCVSDRPLHGEIKLPGMADAFYEKSVSQHLQIGIRAMELLRREAASGTLHSRKLRSFNEPAFR